jgi:uncharacterized protein (TIGR00251 family)
MALITVKVKPSSRVTKFQGILGKAGDVVLKIDVAAPPEKGKANEELIKFLAKKLGIPKNRIVIKTGATARKKKIEIEGRDVKNILAMLKGS